MSEPTTEQAIEMGCQCRFCVKARARDGVAHNSDCRLHSPDWPEGCDCRLAVSERIAWAIQSISSLGQYWREDWSDFDGRTLRDQLKRVGAVLGGTAPPFQWRWDTVKPLDKEQ